MASFRVFWQPEFVLHVGALPWMHFQLGIEHQTFGGTWVTYGVYEKHG